MGIAGKVLSDGNGIRSIRPITFLNVRLAHEIRGCADELMPWLYEEGRPCQYINPVAAGVRKDNDASGCDPTVFQWLWTGSGTKSGSGG